MPMRVVILVRHKDQICDIVAPKKTCNNMNGPHLRKVEKSDEMPSTIAVTVIIHINMLEIKLKNNYVIECFVMTN